MNNITRGHLIFNPHPEPVPPNRFADYFARIAIDPAARLYDDYENPDQGPLMTAYESDVDVSI